MVILTTSVRNFGPRYLPEGLLKLRNLLESLLDEGVLGRILTDLLMENVGRFAGSLDEWEKALRGLASSLADLADCQIPPQDASCRSHVHEDGATKGSS